MSKFHKQILTVGAATATDSHKLIYLIGIYEDIVYETFYSEL